MIVLLAGKKRSRLNVDTPYGSFSPDCFRRVFCAKFLKRKTFPVSGLQRFVRQHTTHTPYSAPMCSCAYKCTFVNISAAVAENKSNPERNCAKLYPSFLPSPQLFPVAY